jgi:hypothetical protein
LQKSPIALTSQSILSVLGSPSILTACHRFRQACQNAIFVDFDAAASKNAEPRLWDAHVKINARFRKILARVSLAWTLRENIYIYIYTKIKWGVISNSPALVSRKHWQKETSRAEKA